MITQDNDFIRLRFEGDQYKDLWIKQSGMPWPPPKLLSYGSIIYMRNQLSTMSDKMASHPMQARGAQYKVAATAYQTGARTPKSFIPELIVMG